MYVLMTNGKGSTPPLPPTTLAGLWVERSGFGTRPRHVHVKAAFSLSETFPPFPSQLYHGKEMKFLINLARKSWTLLQFRHLTL